MNFVTPSGFRDVLTDEAVLREQAAQAVQANMAAKGYLPVETPTLEVMQAGGRLPGTPFKLFDARGDLLAMRPDVTLQIARMCATRLAGQPGPFRFRYMQRVFREAEGQTRAEPRETTQMGVELIGQAGATACWPNRSSLPAWRTSRSRSHRCRCCARCSQAAVLRRSGARRCSMRTTRRTSSRSTS